MNTTTCKWSQRSIVSFTYGLYPRFIATCGSKYCSLVLIQCYTYSLIVLSFDPLPHHRLRFKGIYCVVAVCSYLNFTTHSPTHPERRISPNRIIIIIIYIFDWSYSLFDCIGIIPRPISRSIARSLIALPSTHFGHFASHLYIILSPSRTLNPHSS